MDELRYELPFTAVEIENKLTVINGDKTYYSSDEIDELIDVKADLVDGKIPVDQLGIDNSVNGTSDNPISAKAVYTALQSKQDADNITTTIDENSDNDKYPSAKAVYDALSTKQDTLTFDNEPTLGSMNPVTSDAVKTAFIETIEIAEGKCKVYVVDDIPTLTDWLTNDADPESLKTGDIFLIRDVGVPDFWWEKQGEISILTTYTDNDIIINGKGAARILETTKVDLTDYALKSEIPTVPTNISAFTNDRGYALTSQIPTVPTSLPANGGNADTVDGLHFVVSNSVPTVDDRSVITFVIKE